MKDDSIMKVLMENVEEINQFMKNTI